jgi:Icc-related predicted phosphoesterase
MAWLVVSDLHYALRQLDWVCEAAGDFDLVVIAGDVLDLRSAVPIEAQSVAVAAQVARIGARAPLALCSGNHDLDRRDDAGEKSAGWLQGARTQGVHVDGDALVVGDTHVSVCGWWDGEHGRQALDDRFAAESASRTASGWAWVYHAPPTGSPLTWDGRRSFGDDALATWIARHQPDLVLSGHIHQSPFTDDGGWADRIGGTWVFNPGRQPGPVPAHIVLDLEGGRASWYSIEGAEHLDLTRPVRS